MRSRHAFADESVRRGYLICAVVLAEGDLSAARQAMRVLRKPGQRTIHMATEGGRRRREIVSVVAGPLPWPTVSVGSIPSARTTSCHASTPV